MMRRLRRRLASARAFTLTEMLVVIGIIGVLGGVAVWSVAGLQDVADASAADLAEGGVALRADAARGALLTVAGIELQPLPALLPEPQLGPTATTLTVDPTAGSSPINATAVLTVTVTDQADDPFEDAQVRFEMFGIGFLTGQGAGPTSVDGTTTISYSRTVSGTDTITVCTNADGTLPDDCDDATGPSAQVTHTWTLPRPVLVSWNRVDNNTAEVVWSTPLGAAFDLNGYRVYLSQANCTADSGAATISNRTIVDTVPGGQTTVRFTISGFSLQQGQMSERRLRVLDDTETNVDGDGNDATDCSSAGALPTADGLSITPSDGTTEIGDTATITFTVTDANADGFGGATVRYEVTGIGALDGTTAQTGSNGQTTFAYSRNETGVDTITACTNVDGTAPADCGSATGPSTSTTHTWSEEPPEPLDPPAIVRWNRVDNNTALVVWDKELGATFTAANYRFYLSAANCTNDSGAASITGRVINQVAANGHTTVHLTISGFSLQPGQLNNRRLRVLANAETNLEGTGNVLRDCFAPS